MKKKDLQNISIFFIYDISEYIYKTFLLLFHTVFKKLNLNHNQRKIESFLVLNQSITNKTAPIVIILTTKVC